LVVLSVRMSKSNRTGHGWDHKHGHYQSQKLSYWFLKLQYRYWELSYHFFENFIIWGQECRDKVNTIQYKMVPFEISQNYIVTCFSSQFVLDFCAQNDMKPIILYSKQYKTEFFWSNQLKIEITQCKLSFCVKIKVKSIFHI
jgi:hypothetical protein